jgi:hypothetical protein
VGAMQASRRCEDACRLVMWSRDYEAGKVIMMPGDHFRLLWNKREEKYPRSNLPYGEMPHQSNLFFIVVCL